MPTTVVNLTRMPSGAKYTYIGRPSYWGNPFVIGRDGTREQVIAKYRAWLWAPEQAEFRRKAREALTGKMLGCYCAPLPCHGEVLAELCDHEEPKS